MLSAKLYLDEKLDWEASTESTFFCSLVTLTFLPTSEPRSVALPSVSLGSVFLVAVRVASLTSSEMTRVFVSLSKEDRVLASVGFFQQPASALPIIDTAVTAAMISFSLLGCSW